jgi:4-hydroxy-2-oxoglutarate aldolase
MGGAGATMAVANVVPEYCVKIEDLYKKGQIDEAVKMQLGLLKLNAAVTSGFGIPGMKYALDRVGYYGGPLRSPLLPPSDDQKKEIDKLLESIDASKWC